MKSTIASCRTTTPTATGKFRNMPKGDDKKEIHAQAAFLNPDFMLGRDGRAVRILAEFLAPEHRFERLKIRDTLVFFGSARAHSRRVAAAKLRAALKKSTPGSKAVLLAERDLRNSSYYENCYQLSRRLAEW